MNMEPLILVHLKTSGFLRDYDLCALARSRFSFPCELEIFLILN